MSESCLHPGTGGRVPAQAASGTAWQALPGLRSTVSLAPSFLIYCFISLQLEPLLPIEWFIIFLQGIKNLFISFSHISERWEPLFNQSSRFFFPPCLSWERAGSVCLSFVGPIDLQAGGTALSEHCWGQRICGDSPFAFCNVKLFIYFSQIY